MAAEALTTRDRGVSAQGGSDSRGAACEAQINFYEHSIACCFQAQR